MRIISFFKLKRSIRLTCLGRHQHQTPIFFRVLFPILQKICPRIMPTIFDQIQIIHSGSFKCFFWEHKTARLNNINFQIQTSPKAATMSRYFAEYPAVSASLISILLIKYLKIYNKSTIETTKKRTSCKENPFFVFIRLVRIAHDDNTNLPTWYGVRQSLVKHSSLHNCIFVQNINNFWEIKRTSYCQSRHPQE